ncbi:AraC family transcriptional regulator [Bacillus sp. BHET2]|uniref:helix-turn-helix domain-containing protein n=1 Tax=Bacillus sp. BHET2 TaxID=2583818 RepID=UPI00110D6A93|nr:helix-turn-helix domain-containing protein [Bacillus sp. BHET2]TMU85841.1 AraC family transcriptional regulator [Bacillus sp. BHET2]
MNPFLPIQSPSILHSNGRNYQEYNPNHALSPYVACYWSLDYYASDTPETHRILPDGCVDIIVDLTASSPSKGAFITGLMTRFETLTFTNEQHFFGIRLFSKHARGFLHYPVQEFIDDRVYLEDVWGMEGLLFTEEIQEALGTLERMDIVETKLIHLLRSLGNHRIPDSLQTSLHYIFMNHGMNSIQTLAEKVSYSERTIRRVFKEELGVSPKEFSRIIRFQSMLKNLHSVQNGSLMEVALHYGYYDHAHFTNEFKHFYGLVPSIVFPTRT